MKVGLDIGTMNIVSAVKAESEVKYQRVRDVFLEFDKSAKRVLKLSGASYAESGDALYVIGDTALELANVFGKELRRPLEKGLISPKESDALGVLKLLLDKVLPPSEEGSICYFSVPARPVDDPLKDVVYHQAVFEKILSELGYEPHPMNEAMGILFSETAPESFSGVGISFGAGMVNVAMSLYGMEALSFSLSKGGDWIDTGAANSIGSTAAKICAVKEKGLNLMAPEGREQEAISFFYRSLINTTLKHISEEFDKVKDKVNLKEPIPIVVSGGTSLAGGFVELFKDVFSKVKFPIEIKEIRAAKSPLFAVANGMLIQALLEEE